ncbi:Con-6 family protein [Haemophilus parainfluenzae]|uniref:Con-6 family protein n=1 Tax=Haemophilus parainfluenzae TaxID=729 RepID=UPI00066C02B9|nr:Con-6 family protein [Haemophilus parainfluenzae]
MAFFDFSSSFKKFREEEGILNKTFHGTAALVKGVGNIGIAMTVESARRILNNPNTTSEQKEKARQIMDRLDK